MKQFKVKMTFNDPILGMSPGSVGAWTRWQEWLKSKQKAKAAVVLAKDDELEALKRAEERLDHNETGVMVFPRDANGNPICWDYQIRGSFKDSFRGLLEAFDSEKDSIWSKTKAKAVGLSKWTVARIIDQCVFVLDREIPFQGFDINQIGWCERPLRAETMQGPRIALAVSEEIPAGSTIEWTIKILKDSLEPYVREALDYGSLRGSFGWRNSGKGRFTWEEVSA